MSKIYLIIIVVVETNEQNNGKVFPALISLAFSKAQKWLPPHRISAVLTVNKSKASSIYIKDNQGNTWYKNLRGKHKRIKEDWKNEETIIKTWAIEANKEKINEISCTVYNIQNSKHLKYRYLIKIQWFVIEHLINCYWGRAKSWN